MNPTADMEKPQRSSLRAYAGRNRVPLALAVAVLGVGGAGGAPLASRLVSAAWAAETMRTEVAVLQQEVASLKTEQASLKETQGKQANTQARIDGNVQMICRALKVECEKRPAGPE